METNHTMPLVGYTPPGPIYAIRWRLIYANGRTLAEKLPGSTIRERWPNPIELHLIDINAIPLMRIDIPQGCKPIFYRRRSIGMDLATGKQDAPRLDATVFGYGRDGYERTSGRIWMWSQGRAVDCPPEYIDQTAIELQLAS